MRRFHTDALNRRLLPGRASACIRHAEEDLLPGDKVVIAARVSDGPQDNNGNLTDAVANLNAVGARYGAHVLGKVSYVGSGTDPYWLAPGVALAKQHGAKILFETTDRAIRHPAFDPKRQNYLQARECDLEHLAFIAEGVPLVSDLHPDASPNDVMSYQRRRGQEQKGRKGGRPKKSKPGDLAKRRNALEAEIIKLNAAGHSTREIGRRLNIPESTARRWVRRFCRQPKTDEPK